MLLLTYAISRSKLGYYLVAGGEEPEAAMALGVNVARAKLIAMAMSSFLTAFAGTFWAQFTLYIHPKSVMSLDISFEIAFIALIGGRGSIAGPVLGALLLRPVSDFSRIYFGGKLPGLHLIIFGVVLILVMIYQPRGLQEPLTRAYRSVTKKLFGHTEVGMRILESKALTKHSVGSRRWTDFNLSIEEGEILGLIGPNGAGKSTAFNCIAGVYPPTAGEIYFNGENITGIKGLGTSAGRAGPHLPDRQALSSKTVLYNVTVGAFATTGKRR